jgi:phospholipid/cholesterol/gamma-HCH transport system substrate-binding protein
MHLSKEVKIGLIAVLILLLSVWGINFLKGKNILKSTDEYVLVFDRIDGLIESGIVSYKGFKVGNISQIKFDLENTNKFFVTITLEEKLKIPMQSIVKIKSTSPIVATNELEILFSESTTFHHPGDTLLSQPNRGIADILEPIQTKLTSVLTGIDSLVSSVNLVFTPETEGSLRNSLVNLDKSLAALRVELSPNGALTKSLSNLESITSGINTKKPEITASIENLASITSSLDSANLGKTMITLDSTLNALQSILAKINEGEGSMGKLVNDNSLYAHLDSTSNNLNELMKDLKDHPKRYVHFSVFGKKDK